MKKQSFPAREKLRIRLLAIVPAYTAAGLAVMPLLEYILSRSAGRISEWLYLRLDVLYFFYLVIGLSVIFYHYWRKPWDYLDEVINAAQTVYEQNNAAIELSEPLREVEKQMNQIKMSILLSNQAVKEAEDRKNELVMYLAHDIRTPLTSVIGYLSLLEEEPDSPPEQRAKRVHIALDKAYRLETMIHELFEITRYNSQQITLSRETVDLCCLLVQLMDELTPVLAARGNTAVLRMDEDLTVQGDAEKLARVFGNILKNAAAYSDPQTKITVSARRAEQDVIIRFQNRGEDIPAEKLEALFDKFYRLDQARSTGTGGTGLGLAIAKEIVLLHGGSIQASSENHTVTFAIRLPGGEL